jgi:hypothetical protein
MNKLTLQMKKELFQAQTKYIKTKFNFGFGSQQEIEASTVYWEKFKEVLADTEMLQDDLLRVMMN